MPLTPADVHNVAFKKPSIGKRGYDEDEVDAFLDVVEAELSRLIEENAELTGRLSEYEAGGTPAAARVEHARPPAAAPEAAAAPSGNGHSQAARLLCWHRRRPTGSPKRPGPNRTRCWPTPRATPRRWSATPPPGPRPPSGTAGSRPRHSTREAKARYDEVLGKLATERVGLEKKIEDLRTYEKEYRGRLKSWISDQLAQLDGDANREKATAVVSDPA